MERRGDPAPGKSDVAKAGAVSLLKISIDSCSELRIGEEERKNRAIFDRAIVREIGAGSVGLRFWAWVG